MNKNKKIKLNKKTIELSNLDKNFYPSKKITKKEVIDYYLKISDYILPHLINRPLVMHRFPDGIDSEGFYQKQCPDYFPSWIKSKKINLVQDGKQKLVVIEKKADLIYLVDQGVLVFHVWLSLKRNVNKPDKIIFDLDPPKSSDFKLAVFAALKLKEVITKRGLKPFVMTTGSKGIHVIALIKPQYNFDKIREFAKDIANNLVKQYPDKLTIELRKKKRQGKLLIDYFRNSFGQTAVVPYSLRAIQNAPVATPLDWYELKRIKSSQDYNISNIFKRLAQKSEPWKDIYKKRKILNL
jgi:bifunctional non-homologous end joining protein LigD